MKTDGCPYVFRFSEQKTKVCWDVLSPPDNTIWHPVLFIAHEVATMLQEDIIHRINNQLAVVMGRAELLGCLAGDTKSRDNCSEIELAVQKITMLLKNAAHQQYPESA